MAIIPNEMSLVELCSKLNVTPSWVNKTITELNLQREGRGRTRLFTRDEYYIFRNIKILLICGVSWSYIKELRDKEREIRNRFEKTRDSLIKSATEGKIKTNRLPEKDTHFPFSAFEITFLLNSPVTSPIFLYSSINEKGERIEFNFRKMTDEGLIGDISDLPVQGKNIGSAVKSTYDDIVEFRNLLGKVYKTYNKIDDEPDTPENLETYRIIAEDAMRKKREEKIDKNGKGGIL
jgi:hypothetical protein